jgi:hypothetical protein
MFVRPGLVDNCEFGTGERPTSCMDLQGFWEMIFLQVSSIKCIVSKPNRVATVPYMINQNNFPDPNRVATIPYMINQSNFPDPNRVVMVPT